MQFLLTMWPPIATLPANNSMDAAICGPTKGLPDEASLNGADMKLLKASFLICLAILFALALFFTAYVFVTEGLQSHRRGWMEPWEYAAYLGAAAGLGVAEWLSLRALLRMAAPERFKPAAPAPEPHRTATGARILRDPRPKVVTKTVREDGVTRLIIRQNRFGAMKQILVYLLVVAGVAAVCAALYHLTGGAPEAGAVALILVIFAVAVLLAITFALIPALLAIARPDAVMIDVGPDGILHHAGEGGSQTFIAYEDEPSIVAVQGYQDAAAAQLSSNAGGGVVVVGGPAAMAAAAASHAASGLGRIIGDLFTDMFQTTSGQVVASVGGRRLVLARLLSDEDAVRAHREIVAAAGAR